MLWAGMDGTHSAHGTETTPRADLAGVGVSPRAEMMCQTFELPVYENSRHCVTRVDPAKKQARGRQVIDPWQLKVTSGGAGAVALAIWDCAERRLVRADPMACSGRHATDPQSLGRRCLGMDLGNQARSRASQVLFVAAALGSHRDGCMPAHGVPGRLSLMGWPGEKAASSLIRASGKITGPKSGVALVDHEVSFETPHRPKRCESHVLGSCLGVSDMRRGWGRRASIGWLAHPEPWEPAGL